MFARFDGLRAGRQRSWDIHNAYVAPYCSRRHRVFIPASGPTVARSAGIHYYARKNLRAFVETNISRNSLVRGTVNSCFVISFRVDIHSLAPPCLYNVTFISRPPRIPRYRVKLPSSNFHAIIGTKRSRGRNLLARKISVRKYWNVSIAWLERAALVLLFFHAAATAREVASEQYRTIPRAVKISRSLSAMWYLSRSWPLRSANE